ncbi:hypothetical protein AB0B39_13180 [Micromonospora sp. NPDC049114]|uniref:hypothetical protein n=1 Tax=unclassified Micromonospora TaxID=2617518 RepID=UPI0033E89DC4
MSDIMAEARGRKSYRLLVWAGRAVLLSATVLVLTQVLWANHLISRPTMVAVIAPAVLVFLTSVLVAIPALAIQAAYFSANPLGRGPIERQTRFSQMFVTDLLAIPPSRASKGGKK